MEKYFGFCALGFLRETVCVVESPYDLQSLNGKVKRAMKLEALHWKRRSRARELDTEFFYVKELPAKEEVHYHYTDAPLLV